jgi:hypothetical protein
MVTTSEDLIIQKGVDNIFTFMVVTGFENDVPVFETDPNSYTCRMSFREFKTLDAPETLRISETPSDKISSTLHKGNGVITLTLKAKDTLKFKNGYKGHYDIKVKYNTNGEILSPANGGIIVVNTITDITDWVD